TLTVTTGEGKSTYVVFAVQYPNYGPVSAPPGNSNVLQMITAESSGWRSGWAPSQAVSVYASLKTTPYPGSAGVGIPKVENPMKGDPSALYVLVLWIPLLLAAILGALWAATRWGRWQAWVVGVPIILATLWGFGSAAVQLLPNLT